MTMTVIALLGIVVGFAVIVAGLLVDEHPSAKPRRIRKPLRRKPA